MQQSLYAVIFETISIGFIQNNHVIALTFHIQSIDQQLTSNIHDLLHITKLYINLVKRIIFIIYEIIMIIIHVLFDFLRQNDWFGVTSVKIRAMVQKICKEMKGKTKRWCRVMLLLLLRQVDLRCPLAPPPLPPLPSLDWSALRSSLSSPSSFISRSVVCSSFIHF